MQRQRLHPAHSRAFARLQRMMRIWQRLGSAAPSPMHAQARILGLEGMVNNNSPLTLDDPWIASPQYRLVLARTAKWMRRHAQT